MKTETRLGHKGSQLVEEVREPRRFGVVVVDVSAQNARIAVYARHDIFNLFSRFHSFISLSGRY